MKKILSLATILSALTLSNAAHAATIDIGISLTNGSFTTIASGPGLATAFGQSLGSFSNINVSAIGNPLLSLPTLLDSNTIDVSGSTGTLWIAVTAQGLTSPLSLSNFVSSFTTNAISPGWTVTESTWLDAANGLYTQVTPLGSSAFTSIGTASNSTLADPGTNFSTTELYKIAAFGPGVANDTIDLSGKELPIPPALPLFIGGLSVLGFVGWLKQRKEASSKNFGRPS